jgi:transketolase
MAAGSALAARLQHSERSVFAVLSDAELNEGSVWEAAMFAAHHQLANLVAILDVNGQQALGYTRDVLDLEPLAGRWTSFGWDVQDIDGHDPDALANALAGIDGRGHRPHVLIARTVFGKGVSFMERKIEWHYWPISDSQYEQALSELAGGRA